ncbi:hypothetical protein FOL47_005641 [Perkinsus chesapeaki]|uniref:Uncharacterized protein n=1 Tax=Perkinsus chesapeaki TaxID=330153 RepID=A0A7J6MZQ2_PERCH|nr:hypothetical protein FOL47_005641 [Perkinsus chesapeaki]
MPAIQCLTFSDTTLIQKSDHRQLSSSLHGGAIETDLAAEGSLAVLRVHLASLDSQVKYIAALCRAAEGQVLSAAAKAMNYYVGYEGVEEDPLLTVEDVPLAEDDANVDWFVIGVAELHPPNARQHILQILIVERGPRGKITSVHARNVCSFPQQTGEVESQLQGLIEDTRDDVTQNTHASNTGDYTSMPIPTVRRSSITSQAEAEARGSADVIPNWDEEPPRNSSTPIVADASRMAESISSSRNSVSTQNMPSDDGTPLPAESQRAPLETISSFKTIPSLPLRKLSSAESRRLSRASLQPASWDDHPTASFDELPKALLGDPEPSYANRLSQSRKSLRHIEPPKLDQEMAEETGLQESDTVRLSKTYTTLKPSGRRVETRSVMSPANKGNWPSVPVLPAQTSYRPSSMEGPVVQPSTWSSPEVKSSLRNIELEEGYYAPAVLSPEVENGRQPERAAAIATTRESSPTSKMRVTIAAKDEEIAMLRQQLRQEGLLRAQLYKQRDTADEDQKAIEEFIEEHRKLLQSKAALHIAWFYLRRKQHRMAKEQMFSPKQSQTAGARHQGTLERPSAENMLAHHLRENNQLLAEITKLRGELERKSKTIERIRNTPSPSVPGHPIALKQPPLLQCPRCPLLVQRLAELEEHVVEMNQAAGARMTQGRVGVSCLNCMVSTDLNLSPSTSQQPVQAGTSLEARPIQVFGKGAKPVEQNGGPVTLITPKLLEQGETIERIRQQQLVTMHDELQKSRRRSQSPAERSKRDPWPSSRRSSPQRTS